MEKTMTEDLVQVHHALRVALGHRVPCVAGLIFHSDRGSSYAAIEYRKALRKAGISCNMSRRANCWDKRGGREFLCYSQKGDRLLHNIYDTGESENKDCRDHRSLLQSSTSSFEQRLPFTRQLRESILQ